MPSIFKRIRNRIFGDPTKTTMTNFTEQVKSSVYSQSAEMKEVSDAVTTVNAMHQQQVSVDNVQAMHEAQQRLLKACDTYMSTKSAHTLHGSHRKEMVATIQKMAQSEDVNLFRSADVLYKDALLKRETWKQAVAHARVQKVDISHCQTTKIGGGTSTRLKITNPHGDTHFFTESASVANARQTVMQHAEEYTDSINSYPITPKEMRQLVMQASDPISGVQNLAYHIMNGDVPLHPSLQDSIAAMDTAITNAMSSSDDRASRAWLTKCHDMIHANIGNVVVLRNILTEAARVNGMYDKMEQSGIDTTMQRSLGDRNVATSRLASMLGMDAIVAKSTHTTIVVDGKEVRGVMMEKADGLPIDTVSHRGMSALVDPSAACEMSCLQLMDIISGQTDRHSGNMFYLTASDGPKSHVTGICAIDNDMAFGVIRSSDGSIEQNSGKISEIKYVDRGVADRIEMLDRDKLVYMFGDLLTDDEIDSAWTRVQDLQKTLQHAIKLDQEEWTPEIVEELAGSGINYVSSFYERCAEHDLEAKTVVEGRKEMANAQKDALAAAGPVNPVRTSDTAGGMQLEDEFDEEQFYEAQIAAMDPTFGLEMPDLSALQGSASGMVLDDDTETKTTESLLAEAEKAAAKTDKAVEDAQKLVAEAEKATTEAEQAVKESDQSISNAEQAMRDLEKTVAELEQEIAKTSEEATTRTPEKATTEAPREATPEVQETKTIEKMNFAELKAEVPEKSAEGREQREASKANHRTVERNAESKEAEGPSPDRT